MMHTRTLTAVCIDDEPMDLMLNARVLRASGAFNPILTFDMAEKALAHFRTHPDEHIDVIFLDVNMPRMNGFAFLDAAEKEFGFGFAGAVVIMLTTSLHPSDVARANSFDIIRDYLSKPLTVEAALDIAGTLQGV